MDELKIGKSVYLQFRFRLWEYQVSFCNFMFWRIEFQDRDCISLFCLNTVSCFTRVFPISMSVNDLNAICQQCVSINFLQYSTYVIIFAMSAHYTFSSHNIINKIIVYLASFKNHCYILYIHILYSIHILLYFCK